MSHSPEFPYASPDVPMSILEHVFVPGFNDEITMPSGKTLDIEVDQQAIRIRDGFFGFHAQLAYNSEGDAFVSYGIQTIERLIIHNLRHPDLYAGRLITRSLSYFEQGVLDGESIPYWLAAWDMDPRSPAVDNYQQWKEGVDSGLSPKAAARRTWTGEQAIKHGFTNMSHPKEHEGYLIVGFGRPGAKLND